MLELLERIKIYKDSNIFISVYFGENCYTFRKYDLLVDFFKRNNRLYILDCYFFNYDSSDDRLDVRIYVN